MVYNSFVQYFFDISTKPLSICSFGVYYDSVIWAISASSSSIAHICDSKSDEVAVSASESCDMWTTFYRLLLCSIILNLA